MITFGPATPSDIARVALNMRDRDLAELSAMSYVNGRAEAAEVLVERYTGRSGVECAKLNGVPVAIGSMLWTRPGVVSLLFYATDAFPKVAVGLTRYIRNGPMREAKGRAHRIECFSLSSYTEMRQWVEGFGLRPEATLRQFGRNGEDFIVYAWLRDEEAGKT